MKRIIAYALLSAACGAATAAEEASRIELKVIEPAAGAKIQKGAEFHVRVRVAVPEGVEPPRRVDADFARVADDAHAGQFTESPIKLTRRPDGSYTGEIKVKAPTTSGEHSLKVTALGKSTRRPDAPSTTLTLKDAGDAWTFSEAVAKPGEKHLGP